MSNRCRSDAFGREHKRTTVAVLGVYVQLLSFVCRQVHLCTSLITRCTSLLFGLCFLLENVGLFGRCLPLGVATRCQGGGILQRQARILRLLLWWIIDGCKQVGTDAIPSTRHRHELILIAHRWCCRLSLWLLWLLWFDSCWWQ